MVDFLKIARQEAAEEVRAHLVALRGGAPFLSPRDSDLLVQWLDDGVSVPQILTALETAADKRRKNRARAPLALTHAKRYLEKPVAGLFSENLLVHEPEAVDAEPVHPLRPLVDSLLERARADERPLRLKTLAAELFVIPPDDPELIVRDGLRCIRTFFLDTWNELPEATRKERCATAEQQVPDVDEATRVRLVEERARDELRREYPMLTAASLWDLAGRTGGHA